MEQRNVKATLLSYWSYSHDTVRHEGHDYRVNDLLRIFKSLRDITKKEKKPTLNLIQQGYDITKKHRIDKEVLLNAGYVLRTWANQVRQHCVSSKGILTHALALKPQLKNDRKFMEAYNYIISLVDCDNPILGGNGKVAKLALQLRELDESTVIESIHRSRYTLPGDPEIYQSILTLMANILEEINSVLKKAEKLPDNIIF